MSVTMQDVAKLAGVSRQAVSAVFNNPENCRIPENTQQKILKAAEECGYVPNAMARSLRGAISHNIGIIGSAPYFGASGSLFRCLVHSLKNVGHDIVYRILDETPSNPQKIAREVEMKGVDGLIVLNSYFDYNCFNVPHVVLNNYEKYDVGCNRKIATYMAVNHLIEHGRKRIAHLFIHLDRMSMRIDGWKQAFLDNNIPVDENLIIEAKMFNFDYDNLVILLKKLNVDGIICQNDYVAGKVIKELLKRNIRVPEDIAIMGFDGATFVDFCEVPISTVVIPSKQIADKAITLLLDRIANKTVKSKPKYIHVDPILYKSRSCGCEEAKTRAFPKINTFLSLELDILENYNENIYE